MIVDKRYYKCLSEKLGEGLGRRRVVVGCGHPALPKSPPIRDIRIGSKEDRETAMCKNMQGNILKSDGRDHAAHVFLHFDNPQDAYAFLHEIADNVKSARQQPEDIERYRERQTSAGCFIVCFLSRAGYKALGVEESKILDETAFHGRMKDRAALLATLPAITWDEHFQQEIHAMVLLADDTAPKVRHNLWRLQQIVEQYKGVSVVSIESGKKIRNEAGLPVELFGYMDGISLPVMSTSLQTQDQIDAS
jgi:deferrochelatase/peroxidase EfeB